MDWRYHFFNQLDFLELFAGSFGQELVRESKDTGRAYTGHLWTLQRDAASDIYRHDIMVNGPGAVYGQCVFCGLYSTCDPLDSAKNFEGRNNVDRLFRR